MDDVGWSLLIVLLLTGGASFFSVNTIALRIFSRVKLQDAFKAANKDTLIEVFLENVENLILSCSLYRMIFNLSILLAMISLFASKKEGVLFLADYILIFVIALVVFSIFSLAIPHAWAKYAGEKLLARTFKILTAFAYIAAPVIALFKLYDGLVRRLAGVTEVSPDQQQEEMQEEFLSVVEQQKIEGVVDEEEQQMIEHVLELDETTVEEIMTPRTDVIAVSVDAGLKAILDAIAAEGHSRIPVYEENIDNIIGLVYAKDLLSEVGNDIDSFKLRDKMRKAYFVPETKSLRVLLHEFQNQKLHIAVVLDEYGGTAGIVTIEDILEELVGEIADEYETEDPAGIKKLDETTFEVDARMYIDDINSELEIQLPEDEDYDTVGGFVFSHLGYIPKTGQRFEYENLKFSISAAEPRRINRIQIQKLPSTPEQSQ